MTGSLERVNAATAGRPDLMGDRTSLTLSEGMVGMSENVFINIKNRSFSINADVEVPQGGANGVILAQAGRFGGWSLYLKDGKPTYCYNFLGLQQYTVSAPQAVAAGKATVRMNFDYDGGGVGKGGTATLLVNGTQVASGRIERTQGMIFSADEGAGVGLDDATPVTTDYKERDNGFTGKILKVTVDVKPIGAAVKAEADTRPARVRSEAGLVQLGGHEPRGPRASAARESSVPKRLDPSRHVGHRLLADLEQLLAWALQVHDQHDDRREHEDEHEGGDCGPALRETGAIAHRGQSQKGDSVERRQDGRRNAVPDRGAYALDLQVRQLGKRLKEGGQAGARSIRECSGFFPQSILDPLGARHERPQLGEALDRRDAESQLHILLKQAAALAPRGLRQELCALISPEDGARLVQYQLLAGIEASAGHAEGEREHEGQEPEGRAHDGGGGCLLAFRHASSTPQAEPEAGLVAGKQHEDGPGVEQPHRAPVEKGLGHAGLSSGGMLARGRMPVLSTPAR